MNPLNWNGPEFLVFYLILATALIGAQVWTRRTRETEAHLPGNTPPLTDPYLVAYLAGGANGLIRCLTVALLERKVLHTTGKKNEIAADPEAFRLISTPLESVVVHHFNHARPASDVFAGVKNDPAITQATSNYQASLESAGLILSKEQRAINLKNSAVVIAVLASVAVVRLYLAYVRGHSNVMFLILLCLAACITSLVIAVNRKTRPGREALEDLKQLFGGLKQRAKSGAFESVSPMDVAFVTAVFGVGALGGTRQMYAKELFPAAASNSGCGSSCGSSGGGDGGGSSCGSGGCGGCGGS